MLDQGQVFFEGSDATVETVLLHAIEASETVASVSDVVQLDPHTLRALEAFMALDPKSVAGDEEEPEQEPEPEPEPAPAFAPPLIPWACGVCTYQNMPDANGCEMCGSPRPAPTPVAKPEPEPEPEPVVVSKDDGFGLRLLYLLLKSCALRALSVMLKHAPNVMCAVAESLHPKLLRDALAPVTLDGYVMRRNEGHGM